MSASVLQVPVLGYLVDFDATKAWLEQSRHDKPPTITGKIAYDEATDTWRMVDRSVANAIIMFVDGFTETTKFVRISHIGKTGKFVHATSYRAYYTPGSVPVSQGAGEGAT